ncbi:MAG: hlyA 4, partial [Verrucomicrobiales bacterium]|nr:hlyA 4 [Verrucomicrobiales bacterium]
MRGDQVIVNLTNTWRYEQTASWDGSGWFEFPFDDGSWPLGNALLYFETNPSIGPKNTPLTSGKNTYYFRTHFNFPYSTTGAAITFSNLIDDGAVFYLNGAEIQRIRMPVAPAPITYPVNATSTPAGGDATSFDTFTLSGSALSNLFHGDNILAVEVHQVSSGPVDVVFGSTLSTVAIDAVRQVKLLLPAVVHEGSGTLAGRGQIVLSATLTNDLTLPLISSDPSRLAVPANITISAGSTNAVFDLLVGDNSLVEGPARIWVRSTNSFFGQIFATIQITDDESTVLSLVTESEFREGDVAKTGQVSIGQPLSADLLVQLSSTNTNAIQVPMWARIGAGQTSAVFTITVIDDRFVDGAEQASLVAQVPGWIPASAGLVVLDNETTNLLLSLPTILSEGTGLITNAGSVRLSGLAISNVTVALTSSLSNKISVPSFVTIVAGQSNAVFDISVGEDQLRDGTQNVVISASANQFDPASKSISVRDNDLDHFAFQLIPPPQYVGSNFAVTVSAESVDGFRLTNFNGSTSLSASSPSGPISVQPSALGPFTNGLWTGLIRIDTSGASVRLQTALASGQSNPFHVEPAPFRVISQKANDVCYNPLSGEIFATVPSDDGSNSNKLLVIDPFGGIITNGYPLAYNPDQIEISPGGSYLYVGVSNGLAIQRFDLQSRVAAAPITYGFGLGDGQYHANDFAIPAGAPDSVVVSLANLSYQGVLRLYSNRAPVAVSLNGLAYPTQLAASPVGTTLFGYDANFGSPLVRFDIGALSQTSVTNGLIANAGKNFVVSQNTV